MFCSSSYGSKKTKILISPKPSIFVLLFIYLFTYLFKSLCIVNIHDSLKILINTSLTDSFVKKLTKSDKA